MCESVCVCVCVREGGRGDSTHRYLLCEARLGEELVVDVRNADALLVLK